MPDKKPEHNESPKRDHVSDEERPHSTHNTPRDRAHDAPSRTGRSRSQDVDPDSAESDVDRDDTGGEP